LREPFQKLDAVEQRDRLNPGILESSNPIFELKTRIKKKPIQEDRMKNPFLGSNMDRMPRIAFRMMKWTFDIRDRFVSVGSLLDQFGIQKGQTVVDYGCGPGSYLKHASELVGPEGKVLAVDIHELAVEAVKKRIAKRGWRNVSVVLTDGMKTPLDDDTADIIFALDMFHMVSNPNVFLAELNRICKKNGFLFIDNGHQSRQEAKAKIMGSGLWEIVQERKRFLTCRPLKEDRPDAA
jgi:SAM-dependent methyltransferase